MKTQPVTMLSVNWGKSITESSRMINNPYFLAGARLDFGALLSQITRDLVVGTIKMVVREAVKKKLEAEFNNLVASGLSELEALNKLSSMAQQFGLHLYRTPAIAGGLSRAL